MSDGFGGFLKKALRFHPMGGLMVELSETMTEHRRRIEEESEAAGKSLAAIGFCAGMALTGLIGWAAGAHWVLALFCAATGSAGGFVAWRRFKEAKRRIEENLDIIGRARKAAEEARRAASEKVAEAKNATAEKIIRATEKVAAARDAVRSFFGRKKSGDSEADEGAEVKTQEGGISEEDPKDEPRR